MAGLCAGLSDGCMGDSEGRSVYAGIDIVQQPESGTWSEGEDCGSVFCHPQQPALCDQLFQHPAVWRDYVQSALFHSGECHSDHSLEEKPVPDW